jgi:class 3 adenylate cyclase/alpha-beta hydrolase superfamily lysophospholipase
MQTETRYARSGDVSIAYQELPGTGPMDLVFVHGFVGNLEVEAENPRYEAFFERLRPLGRLIRFDRRGTGLSDRVREVPTLEARMDDLRAVMDAAGSSRALLLATFEAASMAMVYAATYPERVAGLALYNPIAKGVRSPDYPWAAMSEEEGERWLEDVRMHWGTREFAAHDLRMFAPTHAADPEMQEWWARVMRLGASPGAAVVIARMAAAVDVRDVLPSIRVPTLVMAVERARGEAEYVTEHIPEARFVPIGGPDSLFWEAEGLAEEVTSFATGVWGTAEPETVLATILFTDIVGSTAKAAELGDRAWADLIRRHHSVVRAELGRFRGRELDTAGDGFFASFDGPVRAIRCAAAIGDGMGDLGLEVRAGLHTGECEMVGDKLAGIAVNLGARVAAQAEAGEVLVSSTVKDLVAGSDLVFEDRGEHELKGIPGEWRLYALDRSDL